MLKFIYRYFKLCFLKKRGVYISPSVRFNHRNVFEGSNVIHSGSVISNSYIGYGSYVGSNTKLINCQIGRFCSIANNVNVISATHPSSIFVSTSPMFFSILNQSGKSFTRESKFKENLDVNGKSLIIGNDVWIGENVTFKGGISIGDGAIIAMNACVTKDVPSYAIVGGVPAKIIRYRFTKEQIDYLLMFKWWNKPESWLKQNVNLFCNIEEFIDKNRE